MNKYPNVDGYKVDEVTATKLISTDVLVVGAGNAGMMAAAAAQEKGAKVILIEKEKTINLMRVGIASVGSNAQKRAGTVINKQELVESLASFAQHNVDERLLKTWVDNSAESVNWLEDKILKPNGAHFKSEPDAMMTNKAYQGFPTENDPTIDDESFVSYGNWFVKYQKEHKIDIRYQTSLVKLLKEKDTVTGAIVKDLGSDEFYEIRASKGVIIATGGYSANKDLLQKWNALSLKKNVYNDSPRSNGAGITAALNVGAKRDEEPAESIFDRGLVPIGTKTEDLYYQTDSYDNWLWIGSYPFLKVNLRGERFANESIPYQFIVNAASKEPGYLYAMVWDDNYAEYLEKMHMLGCARYGFPGYMTDKAAFVKDTESYVEKGLVVKADTVEELAEQLKLPINALKQAITNNNKSVISHNDQEFGKEAYRLTPVKKAPYYGCILGGRILCTFDGLRVNTKMEVLDENHQPIRHLYAGGNDSGGFFWGSYNDRVPGLASSHAQTFGRLAGKNAAEN
ncbi:FAD-dependent oxidoreductase [Lactobacillus xylocopicola]|uniref:FAD-binding dehydrogenase n=1 Tax=Lactobacillus xylocopicola TaxID=2976676 RepID=A0ABN6SNA3_9LACO|nr:FAD-dependent oxidoreductase [Lactobacillus xylocopicola]BDR60636.1 FAD-binding dehydrogenase [Lactobacillus xylocopicola]